MYGRLEQLAIGDVLDAVARMPDFVGVVTLIDLSGPSSGGTIWVDRNQVCGAVTPDSQGIAALPNLLGATSGAFTTLRTTEPPPPESTIANLTLATVLDLLRAGEGIGHLLSDRVPSVALIPRIVPRDALPTERTATFAPRHWLVLGALDGDRSIADIACQSGLDVITVIQVIVELQDLGVVDRVFGTASRRAAPTWDVIQVAPTRRHFWQGMPEEPLDDVAAQILPQVDDVVTLAELRDKVDAPDADFLTALRLLVAYGYIKVLSGQLQLAEFGP